MQLELLSIANPPEQKFLKSQKSLEKENKESLKSQKSAEQKQTVLPLGKGEVEGDGES